MFTSNSSPKCFWAHVAILSWLRPWLTMFTCLLFPWCLPLPCLCVCTSILYVCRCVGVWGAVRDIIQNCHAYACIFFSHIHKRNQTSIQKTSHTYKWDYTHNWNTVTHTTEKWYAHRQLKISKNYWKAFTHTSKMCLYTELKIFLTYTYETKLIYILYWKPHTHISEMP